MAGVDRVLLPGEREWNLFHRTQSAGITLPADVVAKLAEVAGNLGQEPNWH